MPDSSARSRVFRHDLQELIPLNRLTTKGTFGSNTGRCESVLLFERGVAMYPRHHLKVGGGEGI